MGTTIPLATIQPGVTAPAGSPTLDVDAIDLAIYNMAASLLAYSRGKRLTAANVAYKDRVGVNVTASAGAVFTAADPAMNGRNSIDLSAATTSGVAQVAETNSFTFVAPILHTAFSGSGYSSNLFGSDLGVAAYLSGTSNLGNLTVTANYGTPDGFFANPAFALNTKYIFWISYDAPTKTWRYGINAATAAGTLVGTATRKALTSTSYFKPFGFFNGLQPARLKHSGYAIFDTAYGAGGAVDTNFAALIAAWKTHMGIA